ncbi:MAG TPA: helix-turn-helix domain-containing protein [Kouleothrix sp.]|uniref:helix-turn-helix domain-containing protein n=1 Tax=Kouleothrix sp. TaxID=2779161 RepID=UPI002BBE8583|nr:helix-turn-helix domain-containing protein [Kouleothrix sp.]
MQMIDGVEYLDGDEAVALLGVKKATLYAYVSRGLLSSFRQAIGRRRLYRRDAVETLRELRPSEATAALIIDDDGVLRDVTLPDAASWAGEH